MVLYVVTRKGPAQPLLSQCLHSLLHLPNPLHPARNASEYVDCVLILDALEKLNLGLARVDSFIYLYNKGERVELLSDLLGCPSRRRDCLDHAKTK